MSDQENDYIGVDDDGVYYDKYLAHICSCLACNELNDISSLHHNLEVYVRSLLSGVAIPSIEIFTDTEALLTWVTSFTVVEIWSLTEEQKLYSKERGGEKQLHQYGASVRRTDKKFVWVAGHTIRNTILLAVVNTMSDLASDLLNQRPDKQTLQ